MERVLQHPVALSRLPLSGLQGSVGAGVVQPIRISHEAIMREGPLRKASPRFVVHDIWGLPGRIRGGIGRKVLATPAEVAEILSEVLPCQLPAGHLDCRRCARLAVALRGFRRATRAALRTRS